MSPSFVDDVNSWAEAMIHLLECEQNPCAKCLSIAEVCYAESAELEAALNQSTSQEFSESHSQRRVS